MSSPVLLHVAISVAAKDHAGVFYGHGRRAAMGGGGATKIVVPSRREMMLPGRVELLRALGV
jgi:hypothetical protein